MRGFTAPCVAVVVLQEDHPAVHSYRTIGQARSKPNAATHPQAPVHPPEPILGNIRGPPRSATEPQGDQPSKQPRCRV